MVGVRGDHRKSHYRHRTPRGVQDYWSPFPPNPNFQPGDIHCVDLAPLRGSITLAGLTQGSQSLALGLTLTAAPQLVEGSRLMFDERRLLSLCLGFVHHNRPHKCKAQGTTEKENTTSPSLLWPRAKMSCPAQTGCHGPKRCRYSADVIKALTSSAVTKSPLN